MSDLALASAVPDSDKEFDLFEQLSILYDDEEFPDLLKLCNWYIRKKSSTPDELHIAYSYKALTQVDQHQFSRAVQNAEKAFTIMPGCPWVRFVMLQALEAKARYSHSIEISERAVELGEQILADGTRFMDKHPCSMDISKVQKKAFVNDSRFLLAFAYLEIGKLSRARTLFRGFLRDYDEETSSFTKEEAQEKLAKSV